MNTLGFDGAYAFGLGPVLVERANAAADGSRENYAQSARAVVKHPVYELS